MNTTAKSLLQQRLTLALSLIGTIALILGVFACIKTFYEVFLSNYFTEGTLTSPYTYIPVADRVRLFLECTTPVALGTCFLISAAMLRKERMRSAVYWAVAGPILCIVIACLIGVLKSNGY